MANIQNRRIKRIVIPILIALGSLLLTGAVVLFFVFALPSMSRPRETNADPTETAMTTPGLTDEPSAAPSAASEPSPVPTAAAAEYAPKRISDENSMLLVELNADFDEDGAVLFVTVTGSCAAGFVNNTDVPLYSADFSVGNVRVISATVDGIPARFSVSEDGVLTVPFITELAVNDTCEIFFEFSAVIGPSDELVIPCFGDDMFYELTMSASSDIPMIFTGASPSQIEGEEGFRYSIEKQTVSRITAVFHF